MGMRSFDICNLKTGQRNKYSLNFTFYEYIYDMHTNAKMKSSKMRISVSRIYLILSSLQQRS